MRQEVAAAILRMAYGSPTPREVAAKIENLLRSNGIDETTIAVAIGRFWGTFFKKTEEALAR